MEHKPSRILIVDDFAHTRTLLRSFLTELGFDQIDEASDGQTALQKLHEGVQNDRPFSCVFSDWNMPNMNGLELLQACRKDEALRKVVFVMLTVESEKNFMVKAIQEGATDYILKPFTLQSISDRISKIEARFSV